MTRKSSSNTIHDVARNAGVSVATVSRYMNHKGTVSQEVGERISRVMQELNYIPRVAARQLATPEARAAGLVITNVMNDFFAPLVNGVAAVVSENNYNLLIAVTSPEMRNRHIPSPIGPLNTDGMLVFSNSLSDEQLIDLCRIHFPVVLLYRTSPPNLKVPHVLIENKRASQKLVDHLIEEHGRKRIMFFRGPRDQEDSRLRELGYRASLEAHGLAIDETLILQGEFDHKLAYQALHAHLVKGSRDFDAIFSGNDDAAVGVLTALGEAEICVPEDVSVVGFDDFRMAPFLNPPLTTVRAPTEKAGRKAAELLADLFQGRPVELEVLLPTDIVLRRSCGCSYQSINYANLFE
jgi:LacI family transcriptional regulator